MSSNSSSSIPFSFFCSLLREIAQITPVRANVSRHRHTHNDYPALQIFKRWRERLNDQFSPNLPGTTSVCFRLLFPEADTIRNYNMQETKLAQILTECLGTEFQVWNANDSSGCLGLEVFNSLKKTCTNEDDYVSPISIAQVDDLLDELAANSAFSNFSVRTKYPQGTRRSCRDILRTLYRCLSPLDASFLTQIILKDLQPILYPHPDVHYTTALIAYKCNSVQMLTIDHAMNAWDPSGWLLKCYRVRSNIDESTSIYEQPNHSRREVIPVVGSQIQIPKSKKGQGCQKALNFLQRSKRVWAETKYDGERAQIHVEIFADRSSHITIFSKSGRNSTQDRYAVHSIIRKTLGLPDVHRPSAGELGRTKLNIILDAEMVAWNGFKIDEFWRIRALISSTAHGIRGSWQHPTIGESQDIAVSQASMISEIPSNRNLALVFFDVLLLDSVSLLPLAYSRRRAILESLIRPVTGMAMLSDRLCIDMTQERPYKTLERIFAEHIADKQEGIILKADESRYNDYNLPWVKLKKDYIDGYGDSLDLLIVGAGWDASRAKELRVGPSVLTTFYIGALKNANEMKKNHNIKPHFYVYFVVSYGLTREELEEVNFLIKNSNPITYCPPIETQGLPYDFSIFSGLRSPPSYILKEPLLAELFGAGFTKAPQSKHYELRFPRISKIHRERERDWRDCVDLEKIHDIALNIVGRDRSTKDLDDWGNRLWGKPVSPSVNCPLKRKATADMWEEKLAQWDRKTKNCRTPSPPHRYRENNLKHETKKRLFRPTPPPFIAMTNTLNDIPQQYLPTFKQQSLIPSPSGPPSPLSKQSPAAVHNPNVVNDSADEIHAQIIDKPVPGPEALIIGEEFLHNSLVWFARPISARFRKHCSACSSWKKAALEHKIHALESFLIACGWGTSPASSGVLRGVIVVNEHDATQMKEMALKRLKECSQSVEFRQHRRVLWVFNCTAQTLKDVLYKCE